MISDFVKGKNRFSYPPGIQAGITLHRAIDAFTDTHPATRLAKEIFRPDYRLYSGAIVDVVYDHFLAADETEFPGESLQIFTRNVYNTLEQQTAQFPERFARMFPYMKEQDWLFHYRSHWGTEKSLGGLARRAAYMDSPDQAFRLFTKHYQPLAEAYRHFWNEMKPFAERLYRELTD